MAVAGAWYLFVKRSRYVDVRGWCSCQSVSILGSQTLHQSTAGGSLAFWEMEVLFFAHQGLSKVCPEVVSQCRCGPVTVYLKSANWTVCLKSATFLFSVRFPPTSMEYRREYGMVNGIRIQQRGMVWERKRKEEKSILKGKQREKRVATSNCNKFNLKGVSK